MTEKTPPPAPTLRSLFMDFLRSSIGSKKFMAFLAGLIANVAAMFSVKFGIPEEMAQAGAMKITGLVGSYVVGQGIADHGKEKARVEGATALLKAEV